MINIIEVNATFCPNKLHPNGMQISHMNGGQTRSIFVQSDDAKVSNFSEAEQTTVTITL